MEIKERLLSRIRPAKRRKIREERLQKTVLSNETQKKIVSEFLDRER